MPPFRHPPPHRSTSRAPSLLPRGRAPRGAHARPPARLPDQLAHVPPAHPALADRYHVIAPDHLGFGHSDAPPVDEFTYTFDALDRHHRRPARPSSALNRYAVYVQDYGAPIGWRLAAAHPERDHRIDHPERQRLRRTASTTSGSRSSPTPRDGARTPSRRARQPRRSTPSAGSTSTECPDRLDGWSTPTPGRTTTRCSTGPGNDDVQLALFRDYRDQPRPSTRGPRVLPRPPATRCSRSGASTTRSSARTARAPSPGTCRTRRSTCSTADTSRWRRMAPRSPRSSGPSWPECSDAHDDRVPRPGRQREHRRPAAVGIAARARWPRRRALPWPPSPWPSRYSVRSPPRSGSATGAAGVVVSATQLGYACGLLLVVPLGDIVQPRRLVAGQSLLSAGALAIAVAAACRSPSCSPRWPSWAPSRW